MDYFVLVYQNKFNHSLRFCNTANLRYPILMKYFLQITILLVSLFMFHFPLLSNASEVNKIIDDFTDSPEKRWQFYTDQVMGGVSEGGASIRLDSEGPYVRLEGSVSTANNGGFIQIRTKVNEQ